jgi:hypothetical protein
MFEKFKKQPTPEQPTQESLRKTSEVDPRIMLFTSDELTDRREYVTVKRTKGQLESGWLVVGESADKSLVQIERAAADGSGRLIKVVSRNKLEANFQEYQDQQAIAVHMDSERIAAHAAQQERLGRERAAFGQRAASLVEFDENGMMVVPDWVRRSGGTPPAAPEAAPAVLSPNLQAVAESAPAAPERTASELIHELTAGLSEEDKGHLDRYSRYLHNKRVAQEKGDGNDSTTYGQYAGQEYRAMSQAAKDVASRYQYLWDRIEE